MWNLEKAADFDRRKFAPKCWKVILDDIRQHLVDNFSYSKQGQADFNVF